MKGEFAKNELKLCALFYTWFTKWIRQIKYCNKICSERILMLLFSQKFCKQFASEVSGECSETKLVNKCHSHHILAECEVRGEQRNELMQQRWKLTDCSLCGMWVSLLLPPAFTQQLLQSLRDSTVLVTQKHPLSSQRVQVA